MVLYRIQAARPALDPDAHAETRYAHGHAETRYADGHAETRHADGDALVHLGMATVTS